MMFGKISRVITAVSVVSIILFSAACTRRVDRTEKAEEHDRWLQSLDDSVAQLSREVSDSEMRLDVLTVSVDSMLRSFSHVSNPREVEGYIILSSWRGRYPLTSTGIVARITESEGLELIAALSGGTFTHISVSCGGETVESDVVPHDQALNYRAGGLNTVAFFGQRADSVAEFIATDSNGNIELNYIENSVTGRLRISDDAKRMIAETWRLYSSRREMERLERTLPLLNARIATLRRLKDRPHHPATPDSAGN